MVCMVMTEEELVVESSHQPCVSCWPWETTYNKSRDWEV